MTQRGRVAASRAARRSRWLAARRGRSPPRARFEPSHWVCCCRSAVAALTLLCVGRRLRARLPGSASSSGSAFMLVLLPWLQVIGVYAWIPLSLLEAAVLRHRRAGAAAVTGCGAAARLAGLGGLLVGRCSRRCGRRAVRRLPVGPAGVRRRGHPARRRRSRTSAPPASTFLVALLGTTLAWAVLRRPSYARSGRWPASPPSLALACRRRGLAVARRRRAGDRAGHGRRGAGQRAGRGPGGLRRAARGARQPRRRPPTRLAARIDAGAAPRPDLVVWPENSSDIDPYADPAARDRHRRRRRGGRRAAADGRRGRRTGPTRGWYNRAIVWSTGPGGPGSTTTRSTRCRSASTSRCASLLAPRVSALDQIPSDMVRGTPARRAAGRSGPRRGADVLRGRLRRTAARPWSTAAPTCIVVPTNNATYTGTGQIEQQFAMSRLRAVETGRYVVVASTNGISGIVAPDGHVVARAPVRRQVVLERHGHADPPTHARHRARAVAGARAVGDLRRLACWRPLAGRLSSPSPPRPAAVEAATSRGIERPRMTDAGRWDGW